MAAVWRGASTFSATAATAWEMDFPRRDRKGTSGPLRTGSGEIPSLAEAEPIEQIREELIRRR
jgi:hypothetical protein